MRRPREFDLTCVDDHRRIVNEVLRHGVAIVRHAFEARRVDEIRTQRDFGWPSSHLGLFNVVHIAVANEIIGPNREIGAKGGYLSAAPATLGWWIPLEDEYAGLSRGDAMIITNADVRWADDRINARCPYVEIRFQGRTWFRRRFWQLLWGRR